MPFMITATSDSGAVSIQRDTAVAAKETALRLQAEGMRDVLITDPTGQLYAPADFERLFTQDRS